MDSYTPLSHLAKMSVIPKRNRQEAKMVIRKLKCKFQRYSVIEKECLAIMLVVPAFRVYVRVSCEWHTSIVIHLKNLYY